VLVKERADNYTRHSGRAKKSYRLEVKVQSEYVCLYTYTDLLPGQFYLFRASCVTGSEMASVTHDRDIK
jgi:hypothetical protein